MNDLTDDGDPETSTNRIRGSKLAGRMLYLASKEMVPGLDPHEATVLSVNEIMGEIDCADTDTRDYLFGFVGTLFDAWRSHGSPAIRTEDGGWTFRQP
jgi:hypothetical protein